MWAYIYLNYERQTDRVRTVSILCIDQRIGVDTIHIYFQTAKAQTGLHIRIVSSKSSVIIHTTYGVGLNKVKLLMKILAKA